MSEKRPQVTSWWNEGHGVWRRYYGRATLTVRKHGVGYYAWTVSIEPAADGERETAVLNRPSGTLKGAKAAAEQWCRDNNERI